MTVSEEVAVLGPGPGALMGLDLGTRTLGVAVSDGLRMTATPLETLKRTKFKADGAKLAELCADRGVTGIVMGLPRNMDGSEGPRCESSRDYGANLAARLGLPVLLWDERLSTAAVERMLISADSSRKRRAEVIDKLAAAYILQGVLDRLAAGGPGFRDFDD